MTVTANAQAGEQLRTIPLSRIVVPDGHNARDTSTPRPRPP